MNAEVSVIDQLLQKYPDRKICYDEYNELRHRKENEAICRLLYNSAVRDGVDTDTEWTGRKVWLEMHGFVFSNVERDMERVPIQPDECHFENLESLVEFAYSKCALLGEIIVPEELSKAFSEKGKELFNRFLSENRQQNLLKPYEKKLLVFHIVQTIRDWNEDEDESDLQFWKRLFSSYHAAKQYQQTTYLKLRNLIRQVLEDNHCYFVPTENSKRYYVSMMTHALAPKRKTVALLRLLFGFYEDSLQYQYHPDDDVAFEVFVNSLKGRWNDNIHGTEEIRSDVVSPGIKTLTENRKQYMIKLCNTLLGKIDSLIAGDSSELYPSLFYWDKLIVDWYNDQAPYERAQQRRIRAGSANEFIALRKNQIQIQYVMDQEKQVGIQIPAIRYDRQYKTAPVVKIYHEGQLIDEHIKLQLYRDENFLRSSKRVLPLLKYRDYLKTDFSFRVEIWTDGELYYSTDQKLNCDWICFSESGKVSDTSIESGYLLLPYNSDLECADNQLERVNYDLELYRVNFSCTDQLRINGIDLFFKDGKAQKLRCSFSASAVQNASYFNEQDDVPIMIYAAPTKMRIQFSEKKKWESYRLYLDGVMVSIEQYVQAETVQIELCPDGKLHKIELQELLSERIACEKKYLCIPGFSVETDLPIYLDEPNSVQISIPAIGINNASYQSEAGKQTIEIPYENGTIRFSIPVVRSEFMGENVFTHKEWNLWYEDIPQNAVLRTATPEGWSSKVRLGSQQLTFSSTEKGYEIGNCLKTYNHEEREAAYLFLDIFRDGTMEAYRSYTLAKICFKEQFIKPPFEVRDDALVWCAGENYIGEHGKEKYLSAELSVANDNVWTYTLKTEPEVVEPRFAKKIPEGEYPYSVYIEKAEQKKSIFGRKEETEKILIGNYRLTIGEPNSFRFRGKCLILSSALCYDSEKGKSEKISLKEHALRIRALCYLGVSELPYESDSAYPCYRGTLEFYDGKSGFWRAFNTDLNDSVFEPINPVNIWITGESEGVLYPQNYDDVSIIIDPKYGSIRNKRESALNPIDRKRGKWPDSFNYTVEVE